MEHTIKDSLYLDTELFMELVQTSSEDLNIPIQLIEKDYHISRILRALSRSSYAPKKSYLREELLYQRHIN